jgi:hypothetical protein
MYYNNYIGYKKENTIGIVPVVAAAAIQAAATVAPYVISWASGIFAHPARDTRGIISSVKPLLVNKNASERIHIVLAAASKMPSKDVEAREWLLWYRDNYPNDYKELSVDDKNFWNNYCLTSADKYANVNNAASDYNLSLFSPTQVNYNANPAKEASNLLTSATSGTNNWVLYGAIGIGLLILFSKK